MNIALVKNSHNEFAMICRDENGVIMEKTQSSKDFLRHDLMHFCIEKLAGLRSSFFGRLIDISSDEDEIMETEKIVGIMQGIDRDSNFSSGKYLGMIAMSFQSEGRAYPSYISLEFIKVVRELYLETLGLYNSMKTGDTLNLSFEI